MIGDVKGEELNSSEIKERVLKAVEKDLQELLKGRDGEEARALIANELKKQRAIFREAKIEILNQKLQETSLLYEVTKKLAHQRLKELFTLYEINQALASVLSLEKVLKIIINKAARIFEAEIASILLLDEKKENLTIRTARGLSKKIVETTSLKKGERISGWVVQHKKAVLVKDIEKDSRFKLRHREKYYTKSLISAPLIVKGRVLGVINVNNKVTRKLFTLSELALLQTLAFQAGIAIENARLYERLNNLYLNTINALAQTINEKDHYTHTHSKNVTKYALAIAKQMNLTPHQMEVVERAAKLHDLGKIGIHDYILTKPGKLTPEEWEEIKTHSLKGAKILEPLAFLNGVIKTVRNHHERYDGKGYPDGKKGKEIPVEARIMTVADAFDAMLSERPYRKALSKEQAIKELKKNSGTQFDPEVVKVFLEIIE